MYEVTISMPVYNVENYVEKALISALNQTFDSIEFLIVDDCGTDGSMDIVNRIKAEHPRGKDIRIIKHPHNIGTGATKNTAIDNAKGKYLFFMDSDDRITPDCIEILYKSMKDNPVDFVTASIDKVRLDNTTKTFFKYNNISVNKKFGLAYLYYRDMPQAPITTWNKLYDLKFLRENNIRCFPHHLNEDNVFFCLILENGRSGTFLSPTTYHYYDREDSTTANMAKPISKKRAVQMYDILDTNCRILRGCDEPVLYFYHLRFVIRAYYFYPFLIYNSTIGKKTKQILLNGIYKLDIRPQPFTIIKIGLHSYKDFIRIIIFRFPVVFKIFARLTNCKKFNNH